MTKESKYIPYPFYWDDTPIVPPFDFSEKIAERLAKIGINIVRFHQMDAEWANPNIFQFSKGERIGNTLSLDPKSVNAEGFYAGAIPSVYENGTLKFHLGKEFASMYYLIQEIGRASCRERV